MRSCFRTFNKKVGKDILSIELENTIYKIIKEFELRFFLSIFEQVKEREGSLSAVEAFSLEVIDSLNSPTISEFADFLGISQSNASYKVSSLQKKGYIERKQSEEDGREYHLLLTKKYYNYMGLFPKNISSFLNNIKEKISPFEFEAFKKASSIIAEELSKRKLIKG